MAEEIISTSENSKKRSSSSSDSIRITNSLFLTYPQFKDTPGGDINLLTIKTTLHNQLDRYGSSDHGVIAKERHQDGHWHLHIYWHFQSTESQRRTILHSDLTLNGKRGNYQVPRSNMAVIKYCTKEEDYIWWGIDPLHANRQRATHQKILFDSVVKGEIPLTEYMAANPNEIKNYPKIKTGLSTYLADKKRRITPPEVLWIYGPSGIGKTTLAMAASSTLYQVPLAADKQQWWMDGYNGQEVILFDNLSKECKPPLDWFLKVLDKGNFLTGVKGGMVPITASKIIITSVLSPWDVYLTQCDAQLLRRITVLQQWSWNQDHTDVNMELVDLQQYKQDQLAPSVQALVNQLKTTTGY